MLGHFAWVVDEFCIVLTKIVLIKNHQCVDPDQTIRCDAGPDPHNYIGTGADADPDPFSPSHLAR